MKRYHDTGFHERFLTRKGFIDLTLGELVMIALAIALIIVVLMVGSKTIGIFTGGGEERATLTSAESLAISISRVIAQCEARTLDAITPEGQVVTLCAAVLRNVPVYIASDYNVVAYGDNPVISDECARLDRTRKPAHGACGKACLCVDKYDQIRMDTHTYPDWVPPAYPITIHESPIDCYAIAKTADFVAADYTNGDDAKSIGSGVQLSALSTSLLPANVKHREAILNEKYYTTMKAAATGGCSSAGNPGFKQRNLFLAVVGDTAGFHVVIGLETKYTENGREYISGTEYWKSTVNNALRRIIDNADRLLNDKQFDKAIAAYNNILSLYAQDVNDDVKKEIQTKMADAEIELAYRLYYDKEYEKARDAFNAILAKYGGILTKEQERNVREGLANAMLAIAEKKPRSRRCCNSV
ncbi:hypothetical protein HY642_00925 [Candidatus Woesearchaeota archaeon]|nr:hypothetical protein [Candidatus Woesearchaeota archaeon]